MDELRIRYLASCFFLTPSDVVPGWLATLSWQSIIAVDCYIIGGIVQGIIVLANPDYVPQRWQATLLIIASAIFIGLFNIYAAKRLPLAEGLFATFHVFAFFPIIAILWALAPKQSARAVFLEFTDNGAGWPTTAWAVMVGQVSCMFTVIGEYRLPSSMVCIPKFT